MYINICISYDVYIVCKEYNNQNIKMYINICISYDVYIVCKEYKILGLMVYIFYIIEHKITSKNRIPAKQLFLKLELDKQI